MSVPISIIEESLPDGLRADADIVGTAELNLADGDWPVRKYVLIQAAEANTDDILFGPRGHAATGFRLAPGETSPQIPIDEANKIGIVAASGSQSYQWMAI
jgi:hypothetical protein